MSLDNFFGGSVRKSKKTSSEKAENATVPKSDSPELQDKKSKKTTKKIAQINKMDDIIEEKLKILNNQDDNEEDDELKTKKSKSSVKTQMSSKKKTLVCASKKCGYQKVIYKNNLTEEDYICPRCNQNMQIR